MTDNKPKSSGNALKHGAFSEILILPGEDAEEFEKLKKGLFAEYNPSGASEEFTMMAIAKAHWQEMRLSLYQRGQLLRQRLDLLAPGWDPMESMYTSWGNAARENTIAPADDKSVDEALLELGKLLTLEYLDKELEVETKIQSKLDRLYKRFFHMRAAKQMARSVESPTALQLNSAPVLEAT